MHTGMGKYAAASVSALFGSLLVLTLVITMNRYTAGLDKKPAATTEAMQFTKQAKPPPKKEVKKQKPKPKKQRRNRPQPVLKGLDSSLSGIDLGLAGIGVEGLSGVDDGILGDSEATIMTEDAVDVPPQAVSRSRFVYPRAAKKDGVTGYVVLSLLISQDGGVSQVRVLESSPAGVFDATASDGVRNWRFEPAKYQGKSVKVWVKQKIRFDLG